jgi:uncharacterized protein (TIGR00299 family) protein
MPKKCDAPGGFSCREGEEDGMRIAYFDCLSGISGNMTLGAMLACGLEEATLVDGLKRLPVHGWHLHVDGVTKQGIAATHVEVEEHHHHHHDDHYHHRGLGDILAIINDSTLNDRVKRTASAIFTRLGEAEAAVHGTTPDQVHFHEVGAIDAIVDIVGTAIGLDALSIERVVASPLPLGRGWVTCAHGTFPVPAPATAALVQGVPLAETEVEAELVTPTGAAIITTLAERFGPLPAMTVARVGYGAGGRDLPRPNVLRLFLGDTAEAAAPEIVGLETNLDDVPAEVLGYLMDRLLAAGALDVFYTPIQMKKNRPGVLVRVLCDPRDEAACTDLLFRETTTLGVRRQAYTRTTLPRETRTVETPYGPVRVKVSRWHEVERAEPEYDDCCARAEAAGVPLLAVYQAARQLVRLFQ